MSKFKEDVNMSDLDDAREFAEKSEQHTPDDQLYRYRGRLKKIFDTSTAYDEDSDEPAVTPGQPVQYSLHGGGFAPVAATIKSLPPGSYDIHADQTSIFAVPALPPSGLLVELPEMKSEEVIKIAENFWNSEKDYKEGNDFIHGGSKYRTGVLLWGPPGSGKSSIIKILSKKLVEAGGTVFYASGNPSTVSSFLESFARIEKNRKSIVILEDLDSLIQQYGEATYLEMLDSAKTIDNVFFIATTNYPEKLDARIYNRPGRLSHIIKVGLPGPKAREAYLKAILKDYRDVEYIVEYTKGFTVDHLTSLVDGHYREKRDLKTEIERLRTLFKVPKSMKNQWESELKMKLSTANKTLVFLLLAACAPIYRRQDPPEQFREGDELVISNGSETDHKFVIYGVVDPDKNNGCTHYQYYGEISSPQSKLFHEKILMCQDNLVRVQKQ